ncbi:MAG: RrF2 family transcriptional regulator [Ruminococcus sp.]
MRISVKGKYAIKMLIDIAENSSNGNVSLSEISERQSISKKYLEQIVPMLTKTGIVRANRGSRGGYTLNQPVSKCTLGDILRATEGDLLPIEDAACSSDESIQFLWIGMHDAFNKYIDSISLQDIIERKNESYFYTI